MSELSSGELRFIFNTFSFLLCGALVMWMAAGFTMLEAGSVRTKNVSVICLKNIGLYAISGIAYYVIGYNLMYVDVGSVLGSFTLLRTPSADELALLAGAEGAREAVIATDYAVMSDWFFQMVFVATAASIVSGALAERVKLWSFFVFTLVLTAFIYPIVGAWTWGGGWLNQMGFQDFAGSTIVHATGGAAALAGAFIVGPRHNKFRDDGSVTSTPPSNVPMVTLGVFILWLGWFGFNGGSQLALGSAADVLAMSHVLVNTNLAGAAGVIAGLVSITAGPDITSHYWAIVIGAVGAVLCTAGLKLLERLKIDDVVGAVPAHLFAGAWGTLATAIAAGADIGVQFLGIVSVGAFAFAASWLTWLALEKTMGVRVSPRVEEMGQDVVELGIDAYPEFVLMPEQE